MNKIYLIILLTIFNVIDINAQQADSNILMPFVLIEKGDYREAVDSISVLLKNKTDIDLLIARANAYLQLNQRDKAIDDFKTIEKLKKGRGALHLSEIYLQQNRIDEAENTLVENLKSDNKISLYQLLTNPKFKKIHDSEFMDSILKTNLFSATEKQLYKIEKQIALGNFTEAFFLANEVINRNSNVAEAFYLLCQINLHNSDLIQAKKNIDQALYLKTNNTDYLLLRINISMQLEEYSEALSDINKVLRINPYYCDGYLLRAKILLKNANIDQAIQQADFYLKLYPQNSDALYIKAASYFHKGEDFEALRYINQSLEQYKSVEQYELRGDIYMKTLTFNFAELDYSLALDLDGRNGELWSKKGLSRFLAGNKSGACADWEKGKRYNSKKAIEYLEIYCK